MKHTKEEIDGMRERLAASEWEGLTDRDLKQIIWDGCLGWSQMNDEDIIDYYNQLMED